MQFGMVKMNSTQFLKKTTYTRHSKVLSEKNKFEKIFDHDHAMMPQKHTCLYGIYSTVVEYGSASILSLYQGGTAVHYYQAD